MPAKEDPVNRWLPLYVGLGQKGQMPKPKLATAHTGLLFDKFCDVWAGPGPTAAWAPETPKKGRAAKHRFFSEIAQHIGRNDETAKLLSAHRARRQDLVARMGGRRCTYATSWRFISGIGMGHPLQTGFVWHRTLGVPYLPGSSVKGLIRAWADKWGGSTDPDEVVRLFGPRVEHAKETPSTGALVVFDALPIVVPQLDVDIMNPHYAPYYQEGKPPADYHKPIPIFFLSVAPRQSFEFAVAPRPGAYYRGEESRAIADLDRTMELLQEALANIGAGGKTAVGYGYFTRRDEQGANPKYGDLPLVVAFAAIQGR